MTAYYAYDPTGSLPANKVVNEIHTLVTPNTAEEGLSIIPQSGPFHSNSMVVRPIINGTAGAPLVEGHDYFLCFQVTSALAVGLVLYAGIVFTDRTRTGNVQLSYQTIGGSFVNSQNITLLEAVKRYADLRFVYYDQLVNIPTAFSPAPHTHPSTEAPMTTLINAVTLLKDTIISKYAH